MRTPLIVFRADASLQIGNGHVMRCLTLADALRERGACCSFICRAHPGNMIEQIMQRGYEVTVLPSTVATLTEDASHSGNSFAHANWLGTDWETDARHTLDALNDMPLDWLIVDHYALDARWERSLRTRCQRLMVVDDLADRPHDCDLLLDQNLGRCAEAYAGLVPDSCNLFIGPRYALLRPEFAALRSYSLARRQNTQLKQLLITMGGVDKDNVTSKVLNALGSCSLPPDCRIVVVMGPHAPWLEQVRQCAAQMPRLTEVQVNVCDMAGLMAQSDVAIGAAGGTTWERCCLGLPTILMILASNQKEGASAVCKAGASLLAEDHSNLPEVLSNLIKRVSCADEITALSAAAAKITDGKGAIHLAEVLTHA